MSSTYFNEDNLECGCGHCVSLDMSDDLMLKLNAARHLADTPFVILSAYRCPEHNKKVGGSPTSSHMKGLAVDIRTTSSANRHQILSGLLAAGFTRVGVYLGFIHVDVDSTKTSPVMWLG